MRHHPGLALLAVLLLAGAASAQAVYKNMKLGFSFKPPKDFKAIPVDPTERIVIVKYQSDQKDYGGYQASQTFSSMLEVKFFPKGKVKLTGTDDAGDPDEGADAGEPEEGDEDEPVSTDPFVNRVTRLKELVYEKFKCTKDKLVKVGNVEAAELAFEGDIEGLSHYVLVVPQDDGLYEFEGTCVTTRFTKQMADFSSAAKSFKRVEKVEDRAKTEKVAQMSEQDRFLQEQIDRLPPGWSHSRTKRYLFLYDADKGFVKELEERIEAMRDQYERDYPPDKPITAVSIVRVCGNHDTYLGYGGREGTGGYWYSVARELVVFNYPPKEFTLSVINHEAFHQYIYYFYGQLAPHSWYNEGTGDYYAGAKITKSNKITGFGEAPGGIGRTQDIKEGARLLAEGKDKKEGAAVPLKRLLRFHQRDYYGQEGYDPGLCYAEGWAVVLFLKQGKNLDPKWQRILPDYLKALLKAREDTAREDMEKAIAKAEKDEPGSGAKLPQDIKEWYLQVDVEKVQDRAYDTTFNDWTQADWDAFQAAWLKFVEKL